MPPPLENFSGGHFRPRPKSLPITGSIQPPYPLALTRAVATRTTTTTATTVTPPPRSTITIPSQATSPRVRLFVINTHEGAFVLGWQPPKGCVGGGGGSPPRVCSFGCGFPPQRGVLGGNTHDGYILFFINARVFLEGTPTIVIPGRVLVTPGSVVVTTGSILVTPGSVVVTTGSYSYYW
ncbi:hypothetical protein Tco_1229654 [Tanacetum coccineum]